MSRGLPVVTCCGVPALSSGDTVLPSHVCAGVGCTVVPLSPCHRYLTGGSNLTGIPSPSNMTLNAGERRSIVAPRGICNPFALTNGICNSFIFLPATLSLNGTFSPFQSGCSLRGHCCCITAGCVGVLCWCDAPQPLHGPGKFLTVPGAPFCNTRMDSSCGYPARDCECFASPPCVCGTPVTFPWTDSSADTAFLNFAI